ncbi:ABC transporter substrate-binding protein [Rhodococcoides yunnanense]|uniref:ABC transporter substrate-binding protein n=1 Tax=Rhodococcoides yunnanense TaxID=278209 RepID=UPI0009330CBD|nr:ABC transporter substrate-binding protein [Rhodococcus yunnanensis]
MTTRSITRRRILAAALTVAALALSACGSDSADAETDNSTPAAAADTAELLGGADNAAHLDDLYSQAVAAGQKTITVYGVTATSSASLYEAFSKRYPDIAVNHVSIFGAELQSRIAGEQATKQYVADQVSVSGSDAVFVADKGFVADQQIPLASQLDEQFKPAGDRLFGGNEYLYTVGYNSELVDEPDAPKSFDDLLDPQWAGKIGISDPTLGNTGFVSAAIKAGKIDEKWLEKFKETSPVVFPSERDLFTAVSTGQIELGLGNYIRGDAFLAKDDLPVKFVADFEDGVSTGVFYRGTLTNAPNALASNLLVDWWLTPEAQKLIADQGQPGLMPGAPAVPGQPALADITINPPPTFDEYGDYTSWANALFKSTFS